ncbi:hypothetical protein [Tsuneonella deserti]|uniref:hypothetical protein n=1 Tax=Tsuneonella deserti TaxID=2035528 RepID=UPI00166D0FF6|nr:hypothetical protein [Tsuneonella deserti]
MTTDRQRESNRRNAQRSTGPRTPEGRAISSQNARRHGILSERSTSADEDRQLFDDLLNSIAGEFAPDGPMEILLVERLANLFWRERRLVHTETLSLNRIQADNSDHFNGPPAILALPLFDQLLLGRYQTMLTNQINSTISQLENLRSRRLNDE